MKMFRIELNIFDGNGLFFFFFLKRSLQKFAKKKKRFGRIASKNVSTLDKDLFFFFKQNFIKKQVSCFFSSIFGYISSCRTSAKEEIFQSNAKKSP